jgi:hypothetical protein
MVVKNIRQVGIEWAIQQSLELKAASSVLLLFYGKSENIKEIASRVLEANLAIGYIFFRLVK